MDRKRERSLSTKSSPRQSVLNPLFIIHQTQFNQREVTLLTTSFWIWCSYSLVRKIEKMALFVSLLVSFFSFSLCLFFYVILTDVLILAGLGNSRFQDLKSCFHVSTWKYGNKNRCRRASWQFSESYTCFIVKNVHILQRWQLSQSVQNSLCDQADFVSWQIPWQNRN